MLNNLIRPLVQDNPPPRILLLRISPLLVGLFVIFPGAIYLRSQQPPTDKYGLPLPMPIEEIGAVRQGQPGNGVLAEGQRHGWRLDGEKGQRFAITLGADWDSHLALYMPDGIQTLTQDGFSAGNGRAWIDGVTLPVDGAYMIVVSGENGGAGGYRIELTDAKPAQAPIMLTVGSDGLLVTQ
jgi:hypothetical protein